MHRRLPAHLAHPALPVLLAAVLLVAACGANTPSGDPAGSSTPSGPPSGVPTGSSTPLATGSIGPAPSGSAGEPGDTSTELITAAYEGGRIDRATALVYRLQASVGDDRLPGEFRAPTSEDDGAAEIALAEWGTFTAEQQAAMRPYLVRPTDPGSVFAPASTAAGGGAELASIRLANVPVCENGFMRAPAPDGLPLVVWGQCGGDDLDMQARMEDVLAIMTEAWGPMTDLMGWPLGDANVQGDDQADSLEAGDGLLDVYVVAASVSAHARRIDLGDNSTALAVTRSAPPYTGPRGAEASSSFIVVSSVVNGGPAFRSTIIHEFFHSLQFAHNNRGTIVTDAPGAGAGWVRHWFMEASAVWAEHHFVPAGRKTEVYPRFETFQSSEESLSSTAGSNEYASWAWPFFMAQENEPEAIGSTWIDFEGRDGFDALQGALDAEVSFTKRFRDFAVRAYNQDLQPGDPIDPMFADADPGFPDDAPGGVRMIADQVIGKGDELSFDANLPSLRAMYVDLAPEGDNLAIEFDWSGLSPAGARDVDVLVETARDGWQRRSEPDRVCDAKRVIVVLANHDPRRETKVTGAWKATGSGKPCNDGNFTVTLSGAKAGAGTYTGRLETVYCSLRKNGAWMVRAGLDLEGDIRSIDATNDDGPGGGLAGISVNTRWAYDDPGDWDWGENWNRSGSVTITGDTSAEPWRVHIASSWQENDKIRLSVTADVVCSETYLEQ